MLKQVFLSAFKVVSTGLLLLSSTSTLAMSLSTYRIYLDNDNNTASFIMFNRTTKPETCQLNTVHKGYDEFGGVIKVDDEIVPANSAKPWMRYSPKNFTAAPRSTQTVRFTLRRKANTVAAEYRSYLEVFCDTAEIELPDTETDTDFAKVGMKPRLVQHVPIIVRTGKLSAKVNFSDFSQVDNTLSFILHRQGNRSVNGTLQLIDKKSGEVLGRNNNVTLYTESLQKARTMGIPDGMAISQLALRFVEDERYGGSIDYQQDVVID